MGDRSLLTFIAGVICHSYSKVLHGILQNTSEFIISRIIYGGGDFMGIFVVKNMPMVMVVMRLICGLLVLSKAIK